MRGGLDPGDGHRAHLCLLPLVGDREMGEMEDGQDAEEQQQGRWGVSLRSKEGIAKSRTRADAPVVPAGCHLCLPPLPISFQKKYLWRGIGVPSPRTSVTKLSLRNLQPWPLSNMREMPVKERV